MNIRKQIDLRTKGGMYYSLIFVAIGLALIVFAVVGAIRKAEKLKTWQPAEATIQSIAKKGRSDYDVTLTFEENGRQHTAVMDDYFFTYRAGKTIPIVYDPADPTAVTSAGWLGYFSSGVIGLVGLAVLIRSGMPVYKYHILPKLKKRREETEKDTAAPWEL